MPGLFASIRFLAIGTQCATGQCMTLMPSSLRNWGATRREIDAAMTGDEKVSNPNYMVTMAIEIDAGAQDIWPWLVQMGYHRGGLYSYDWLDRLFGYLDEPSAERLLPEHQELKVGDVIPIGRGAAFPVTAVKPLRYLVMSGREREFQWSWELAIVRNNGGRARLISRNRARTATTLGARLFMLALDVAAFLMTRRMLIGVKRRAEALARARQERERTWDRLAS